MRRFFTASFIALALIISASVVAPAAHAQTANGGSCFVNADCASNYCSQTELLCKASATSSSGNTYALDTAPGANQPTDPNIGKDTASQFGTIMTWLMSLFAWLLGVAALTLNYAVFYTVVAMGDYVNNLSAVGVAWTILRDLGNIIIIFGFLAIGITTILNVNWYGGGFKMLPMLLVSAVFLNFSLFITEAVIDTGNLFATQFYTQINGGKSSTREALSGVTVGTFGFGGGSLGNEAISNAIMGKLGFQTIYGQARNQNKELFNGATPFFIGFMGVILFLIAAFVIFSLAFVLIARFVILLFLIIISPIGFAGLAIPQLAVSAKKWWGTLFEQAITAPVLLLLLYIALTVITDERFLTGSGQDWTGFATGNFNGFASMMLSFLVAMGLLLAVVIISKKMSAFGGSWATKTAGKLTFGLTAAGMRSTAGWGLQAASKRFRSSKLARVPVLGRTFAGALDRGAKASFDVRGATIGGGLKEIGVEAGEAQKGGYRKQLEEAVKGREEHAKTLEQTKVEKEKQKDAERRVTAAEAADATYSTTDTKNELKNAQAELAKFKQAPQIGYARGLRWGPGKFLYRNTKAAENIIKNAGKSKEQKDVDALMGLLKNVTAPSTFPPAGGGAKPTP